MVKSRGDKVAWDKVGSGSTTITAKFKKKRRRNDTERTEQNCLIIAQFSDPNC
jgi:hypothetical protein